ncbi:uncharacterized protein EV420DRAFT_519587 [Desarmillaria tabescens]|uniref:TRIP4/RQT4 C2HC5-type zinc finger domain-containing protein n=1 Tax=Armillaria tabescens TaxID=1929756 RepID=A0AA39KA00_ARMTA|nr:uncharacterized protein EV420DRAFT_519587 [Desarmillaria tabescens]KAK0457312.1 hypothetical protein EV420DRAFT_519587 [Desarmillaria tabescens]
MSTPWTRTSSSLPSDRIKPRNTQTQSKSSGKQKQEAPIPKSKPLLALESLLRALQSTTTTTPAQDPKGGCFCQAREHPLSPYTPTCPTCGLVLCTLNLPQHACLSCRTAPPPRNRDILIGRLQGEIVDLTRREEEARERAREEARVAAGAFPSLSGGERRSTPPPPPPQQQQHKVLSLNRKTKKVTVSSYPNTPASSRPDSPAPEEEDEPLRVPPPPGEVVYAKRNVDRGRPYANFGGGAARYEKGKRKGKENEAGPS